MTLFETFFSGHITEKRLLVSSFKQILTMSFPFEGPACVPHYCPVVLIYSFCFCL